MREGSSKGADGRIGEKASGGGEDRAGSGRKVKAETQMEGRTEGWHSRQEKSLIGPKKAVNR